MGDRVLYVCDERINRIYDYKKDNKNNEWISNDKEIDGENS